MSKDLLSIIELGAKELDINLPPEANASFSSYHKFLAERGSSFNLTAISKEEDVARLHFLDSIALLKATKFENATVIDVGSGAGFPGIPLKIAEPSIILTLLDATGKRVNFLSDLCNLLSIDASFIHARAEDSSQEHNMRERYDIAVSRAVARLNVLCELCLPFVRIGGMFIAMKGVDSEDELIEAGNAIEVLGAKPLDCYDYTIPGTDIVHRAVLLRKIAETPKQYPRRFARIQKAPL